MSDIEYFYSAHSGFAYLGSARFMEIVAATGSRIVHKPIRLRETIEAGGLGQIGNRSQAHIDYYFGREIERWAEHRGVPVKLGLSPNHSNDTTLVNCMLIAGTEQGHNVDQLAHSLLEAHWVHHADLANEAVLTEKITAAGLNAPELLNAARTDDIIAIYDANTAEAIARSVFGSPTYFVDGDMFYGQDHLEMVERAINKPYAKSWPVV